MEREAEEGLEDWARGVTVDMMILGKLKPRFWGYCLSIELYDTVSICIIINS